MKAILVPALNVATVAIIAALLIIQPVPQQISSHSVTVREVQPVVAEPVHSKAKPMLRGGVEERSDIDISDQ